MPDRITLCIIAGNESAHIVRMLDSFAAAFDELSLVRAIGTATPDNTAGLAAQWCADNSKAYLFSDYANHPQSQFSHVDDFAAARNQAFAQGTGDWLLWADCDDTCTDAKLVRVLAADAAPDVVMLRFPYSIPQNGKITSRERLIRRGTFAKGRRWHWPVHENLLIHEGDKWEAHDAPVWVHEPSGDKAGGDKRNLRILTAALREAPSNYYYCHQENFYLRQADAARRFGELFLGLPNSNPAMRYQCLLNLCELAVGQEEAAKYALLAHHLFPRQKEAVAALVKCAFQEDNAERALHWSARLMEMPLLPMQDRLWCYEPKWDGWGKFDLRRRALRLAGREPELNCLPLPPRISLLHATRGRVSKAIQTREVWLDHADHPELVEHIFAVDRDDAPSVRWLRSFGFVMGGESNCVSAWNAAARAAHGGLLVQLSDDWIPSRGWDTALLAATGGRDPLTVPYVLQINDGTRKDDLLCMAILSKRRLWDQESALFSPAYESVFSDNEFSWRAFRDGVVIDARHITFHHMHPAFGRGEMDETYRRQNAPEKYQRGEKTFRERNPDAP